MNTLIHTHTLKSTETDDHAARPSQLDPLCKDAGVARQETQHTHWTRCARSLGLAFYIASHYYDTVAFSVWALKVCPDAITMAITQIHAAQVLMCKC